MSFNLKTYKLSPALTKEYTQAHLLKTFHIQIKLISIYKRKCSDVGSKFILDIWNVSNYKGRSGFHFLGVCLTAFPYSSLSCLIFLDSKIKFNASTHFFSNSPIHTNSSNFLTYTLNWQDDWQWLIGFLVKLFLSSNIYKAL